MSFIYKRITIAGAILYALALSAFPQYEGGSGSGSILVSKLQTSCPLISYPAIFTGGTGNGISQAGITQSICTPVVLPAIFNGGSGNNENAYHLYAGCAPVANFEADTTYACTGDTVHFTDLSEGNPISWSWSFPGGVPSGSTVQNPSVSYTIPGSYDITLYITTLLGNNSITKTSYITAGATPSVSLGDNSPVCENTAAYPLSGGNPAGGIYSGSGISSGVFDPAMAGAGTHTVSYSYTNGVGCSDSAEADIIVHPVYSFMNTHEMCDGESYNWQGNDYTTAGTYTASYTSINGCDSVYTLILTVNPVYSFSEDHRICDGETYNWQGSDYTISGTYTASYTSNHGCDSIYTLSLTVGPVYSFSEDHRICDGETYNWQGNDYTTAGTYTAIYTSINGCDSVYTLILTVNPVYSFSEDHHICDGEIYNWQGNDYTTAGTYTASYNNIHGCDSIYTLSLTVTTIDVGVNLSGNTIAAIPDADGYQWLDCGNLYAPIADAVSHSYTATASGNYAVLITQGLCADTSACVQVTIVGMATLPGEGVSIYPNPVSHDLTIEMKGNLKTTDFEILNSSGQVVYTGKMQDRATVPTSQFTPGVYLLKLENGKSFVFKKIIKE